MSDKPGHHDPHLLARLALPGGLLLPPLLPGRPTRDCLFRDPCCDGRSVLKVWNRNACGGVVAVFNLQVGWLGLGVCTCACYVSRLLHSAQLQVEVILLFVLETAEQCLPVSQ